MERGLWGRRFGTLAALQRDSQGFRQAKFSLNIIRDLTRYLHSSRSTYTLFLRARVDGLGLIEARLYLRAPRWRHEHLIRGQLPSSVEARPRGDFAILGPDRTCESLDDAARTTLGLSSVFIIMAESKALWEQPPKRLTGTQNTTAMAASSTTLRPTEADALRPQVATYLHALPPPPA